MYQIQKNLNRILNGQHSFFLDPKELMELKGKIRDIKYFVYYPYKDSEKSIVYTKNIPEVLLYEIKIKVPVRHQDILGAIYSLNISKELFGDILLIDGRYYIYILPLVRNYFESNFLMVKNTHVTLEEIPIDTLKDFERSYEKLELIVSSNRIDTIVCSICHIGRNNISNMIQRKDILINYDYLKDASYKLKNFDIFSIRKIGKFQYRGIIKYTKSNNLIVEIWKYL